MAKGKRAVALFEVIRMDKRFDRKSPPEPEKPPVDHSRQFAKQAVDQWRKNHADPETWTDTGPALRESIAALWTRIGSINATTRSHFSTSVAYVRLWISRSNGVVPGAAAAAIVILVMLAARHWIHPALAEPTIDEALRAGPAHPEVLAISTPTAQPRAVLNPATPPAAPLSPEMAADEEQAAQQIVPNLAKPGARIVNMHYVLMQSYFEQKTAQEACDFLNQNGISCTIERGVKGWRADFYQVIGLEGFVHPSGPQYTAYRDQIEELGKKFSPKSRYKRFQPEAIKW